MTISEAHRAKFANFTRMIEDTKAKKDIDVVLVADPEVLGDTYEELVTNLNLLREAELGLMIAKR